MKSKRFIVLTPHETLADLQANGGQALRKLLRLSAFEAESVRGIGPVGPIPASADLDVVVELARAVEALFSFSLVFGRLLQA